MTKRKRRGPTHKREPIAEPGVYEVHLYDGDRVLDSKQLIIVHESDIF